jgi:hypothetical protein
MKFLTATVFLCASLAAAPAQTAAPQRPRSERPAPAAGAAFVAAYPPSSPGTARKAAAGRTECVLSVGLCVTIPASWQRLGDVFEDLGFVAAEPHPGVDSAAWPQFTVAAINLPAQNPHTQNHGGTASAAPSLDSLLDLVLTPDGSFASAQTLQRTRLLLNGADAEIVSVQLHDEAGNAGAIEAIALIQGDDGLVYSIALRCAPQDFARLEPLFQQTARSWRIKAPASAPAPPSPPKQDSGKQ